MYAAYLRIPLVRTVFVSANLKRSIFPVRMSPLSLSSRATSAADQEAPRPGFKSLWFPPPKLNWGIKSREILCIKKLLAARNIGFLGPRCSTFACMRMDMFKCIWFTNLNDQVHNLKWSRVCSSVRACEYTYQSARKSLVPPIEALLIPPPFPSISYTPEAAFSI